MMSLPFYQKLHQHYDRSYRNRDLSITMSQYQQEKKSSAIYTHGSTAYSSRSSAAHRQESAAFSQASAASYQHQASRASEFALSSAASHKAASAYDYGYSHRYVKAALQTRGKAVLSEYPTPTLGPRLHFHFFVGLAALPLNQVWSKVKPSVWKAWDLCLGFPFPLLT